MKKKLLKTKKVTRAKDFSIKDLAVTVSHLAGAVGNLSATVDNLAIMVAKGFDRMDERFARVDERTEDIEKKVGQIDGKVDELDGNIKATRRDVLDIGDRFVSRYEFDNTLVRISRLEEKMREKTGK